MVKEVLTEKEKELKRLHKEYDKVVSKIEQLNETAFYLENEIRRLTR
jgi:hypothetical protein